MVLYSRLLGWACQGKVSSTSLLMKVDADLKSGVELTYVHQVDSGRFCHSFSS
jgi:hypothetical protein